ncbi:hypothetical protein ATO12_02675 [Aquimarina atlantica]|uniref:DUF5640 domain-containing protein n=1 Tax=Aquimarina atlantica TaxID=1317122 RepID=A0A023C0J0_9FLAO|nr:hypothetical protein [Aquimarina atlantica]EZH75714.1 hypothetical protein ATO12_02675 [Aquimarina atlantica]
MKNSTLLFRSISVVILLAGSAHLASYASQSSNHTSGTDLEKNTISQFPEEKKQAIENEDRNNETSNASTNYYNEETDYIIGNWRVTYNSKEFRGAIVYTIKKEGNVFNAYTYQYEDESGNSERAKSTKTLVIKSFDGYKGKGIYTIEYKKQIYDIECAIDMVDENTFKLSYDYYGYSDVETWKRQ